MTPEVIAKLEDAFSVAATDEQACLFAGISMDALYEYQRKNPQFAQKKRLLKDNLGFVSKRVLGKAIEEGDAGKAAWWLERKEKDEFSLRSEHKAEIKHEHSLSENDQEIIKRALEALKT